MLKKYTTLYEQAEFIDKDDTYNELEKLYKNMNYEEILNIANELAEILEILLLQHHKMKLDIYEIGAITNKVKEMQPVMQALDIVKQVKQFHQKNKLKGEIIR
jgi:hypothetical protein